MNLLSILYYIVGILLTIYWFIKKYKYKTNEISNILLVFCIILWPFKLLYDLIKKY